MDNGAEVGQYALVHDSLATPPSWVEEVSRGLLANGFILTSEREPTDAYWFVLTRGTLTVKLLRYGDAWDIVVEGPASPRSEHRWSNRTTSVHLLRGLQYGPIDVNDAETRDAEDDGRWLLGHLEAIDELMSQDCMWRDVYEVDRSYMRAHFGVELPQQPDE